MARATGMYGTVYQTRGSDQTFVHLKRKFHT